jgi:hypothetical protein
LGWFKKERVLENKTSAFDIESSRKEWEEL